MIHPQVFCVILLTDTQADKPKQIPNLLGGAKN